MVPGSLTVEKCSKYSEFVKYPGYNGNNFCNCIGLPKQEPHSDKLVLGYSGSQSYSTMSQIAASKLIDKKPLALSNQYQLIGGFCANAWQYLVGHWLNNTVKNVQSTFDHEVWLQYHGNSFSKMQAYGMDLKYYEAYVMAGSNIYYNKTLPHEYDNAIFRKNIDLHNSIVMVYYQANKAINNNDINASDASIAALDGYNQFGALSAKMTSELDAKIDDGRPGSGKFLALKSGTAHRKNATENDHLLTCYDKKANEVDKAIYHSSTANKYGCNLMYLMEDVK